MSLIERIWTGNIMQPVNRRATIIIVEDTESDFHLVKRAFDKAFTLCGLRWFKDGEEAARFLLDPKHPLPSLIVSDLKMPRMNGIELLRKVRSHERTKNIPFIILTSSNMESDRRIAEKNGVSEYWVKPLAFNSLIVVAEKIAHLAGCEGSGRQVAGKKLASVSPSLHDQQAHSSKTD
jgi:CheY-like chemotaxis protein